MNGIHDLGGMHGLGPVVAGKERAGVPRAMGRAGVRSVRRTFVFAGYTVDEFRHAIEKIEPAHYLESSYYEHWLHAFEEVLGQARHRQPRRAGRPGGSASGGGH